MRPGIGRRAFPGRPVAGGDAGVGTAGRLAQGGEWLRGIGGRHALEAERGRGIEEAIRERADMEGARDAGEHDALLQDGWHTRAWTARKGYAITDEAVENSASETLWCSPHCVPERQKQEALF